MPSSYRHADFGPRACARSLFGGTSLHSGSPPTLIRPHGTTDRPQARRPRRRNPCHRLRHLGMLTGPVGEIVAAALRGRLSPSRRGAQIRHRGRRRARASGRPRFRAASCSSPPRCRTRICAPPISRARSRPAWRRSASIMSTCCWCTGPMPQIPLAETMGALARAKRDGLARHLGVANFNIAMLDEAIRLCPEPLVNLQVEYHPYLDQTKMLDACRRRGLIMTGYCPLGRGRLIDDPVIGEIARRAGKTAAQVALRWPIQQGNVVPIPRSSNPQRIAENFDVFDFTLDRRRDETHRGPASRRRPHRRSGRPRAGVGLRGMSMDRPAGAQRRGTPWTSISRHRASSASSARDPPLDQIAHGLYFGEGPGLGPAQEALPVDRHHRRHDLRMDAGRRHESAGASVRPRQRHDVRPRGPAVIAGWSQRTIWRIEHDGSFTTIASRYQGKKFNSPNDIVVRSRRQRLLDQFRRRPRDPRHGRRGHAAPSRHPGRLPLDAAGRGQARGRGYGLSQRAVLLAGRDPSSTSTTRGSA